jgi:16S rRNA (uracil1498-N3)-methyltransferase
MTRRYFVPELPTSGGLVAMPPTEANHATRVMRIQIGDRVTLFDGKGSQSDAIVTQVGRNECHCDAQPSAIVDREPTRAIHLGIALPKPDRARELIERLTELGVKSITPLVAQRTQRPPSDSLLEKLERGVIEASKQCERNELLQIKPTQDIASFFASESQTRRLIAHQSVKSISLETVKESASKKIIAAIGPEGGWTDDEFQLATDHGFEPVNLGKRIYRVETAATVLAAVLVT